MVLEIQGLSKTYPNGTRALIDVSLRVEPGMFGLLGPNGAGKSTLMRTVATLQSPDEGTIQFGDINVLSDKKSLRRTLGYLPQEFGLYPKVSALKLLDHFAILEGMLNRKERKAVVDALLQQTNLWHARKVKLGEYSGGMRQRFGIAVALLGNPKLIIVDEPTAGLDPEERVRFLNLLAELGRDAVVILSTHIVDDVAELCSRMAIINEGRIKLEAEPPAATEELRGQVWKRVIESSELDAIREQFNVLSNRLNLGRNVVRVLAKEHPGEGFESAEPDLEDVYFAALRTGNGTKAEPGEDASEAVSA